MRRFVVLAEPKPTKAPTATDEDLEKLLAVCEDSWSGRRDRAVIFVLALTGMRRGEKATMRQDDPNLAEGLLRIPNDQDAADYATIRPSRAGCSDDE